MEKNKNTPKKALRIAFIILVILVIVVAIILYYGSFGKIDLTETIEDKLFKHNAWIDHRIKKLERLYSSKTELKKKLDSYVSNIFFAFRIISVSLFIVFNTFIFLTCGVKGFYSQLECVLNVNEALVLAFLTGSFLFAKKILGISSLIKAIHLKIRKLVYRDFKSLDEDCIKIKLETENLNQTKRENIEKLEKIKIEKANESKPDKTNEGYTFISETLHNELIKKNKSDN